MTFNEPPENSAVFEKWAKQLGEYVLAMDEVQHLRDTPMGDRPWPERDNPMFGYIVQRAMEIYEEEGDLFSAIGWAAAHAWFEGSLETHQLIRDSIGDTH